MQLNNIFTAADASLKDESIENILTTDNFFVEKIISEGHVTPEGQWYDQNTAELVFLLKGGAVLQFENNEQIEMNEGDYLLIEKHKKHRVIWTDKNRKTYWLALHYR